MHIACNFTCTLFMVSPPKKKQTKSHIGSRKLTRLRKSENYRQQGDRKFRVLFLKCMHFGKVLSFLSKIMYIVCDKYTCLTWCWVSKLCRCLSIYYKECRETGNSKLYLIYLTPLLTHNEYFSLVFYSVRKIPAIIK
jgi:hypothetical protein